MSKQNKSRNSESSTPDEVSELWPGESRELLKSLHILTRDGKLNQDSRRKLKQIRHLVQLITPHLDGLESIVDVGAGKSYLGFMIYDLWLREREATRLYAVEQRDELIKACKLIASRSGFNRITFVSSSITDVISSQSEVPVSVDVVTALHACDTATDEAITFALAKNAKVIALVPCCQAEVARLLEHTPQSKVNELGQLWRHGIHRREFGSHLTNVIRALFLESRGYKVRVTELVGWEHSMKNEFILAEKFQKSNPQAQRALDELLQNFSIRPRLFELCDKHLPRELPYQSS